jgi:hypothetical protein
MMATEILVVQRSAAIAHPSYATGGYIVLHPGAVAYRNADFVAKSPAELLAWCRSHGCEVTYLSGEDASTRRHRIRFPDAATFDEFRKHFG